MCSRMPVVNVLERVPTRSRWATFTVGIVVSKDGPNDPVSERGSLARDEASKLHR